jgi:hypothetical protein
MIPLQAAKHPRLEELNNCLDTDRKGGTRAGAYGEKANVKEGLDAEADDRRLDPRVCKTETRHRDWSVINGRIKTTTAARRP